LCDIIRMHKISDTQQLLFSHARLIIVQWIGAGPREVGLATKWPIGNRVLFIFQKFPWGLKMPQSGALALMAISNSVEPSLFCEWCNKWTGYAKDNFAQIKQEIHVCQPVCETCTDSCLLFFTLERIYPSTISCTFVICYASFSDECLTSTNRFGQLRRLVGAWCCLHLMHCWIGLALSYIYNNVDSRALPWPLTVTAVPIWLGYWARARLPCWSALR
jgi:hypothetical protein